MGGSFLFENPWGEKGVILLAREKKRKTVAKLSNEKGEGKRGKERLIQKKKKKKI